MTPISVSSSWTHVLTEAGCGVALENKKKSLYMAHLPFIKESKSRDCWKQGARDMSLEWFHHSVLHNSSFTFILFFLQFLWQKSNTVKGIKTTPWKTNVPIWIGAAIRQNIAAWLCSSLRKIHPIIPAWIYIFGLPNRMPCIILVGGDVLPLGHSFYALM